jgi:hypothetical protein
MKSLTTRYYADRNQLDQTIDVTIRSLQIREGSKDCPIGPKKFTKLQRHPIDWAATQLNGDLQIFRRILSSPLDDIE